MRSCVKTFKTGAAMAAFAAGILKNSLRKKKGRFLAAVSGGETPRRLFRRLSAMPLPWEQVVFFLADERLVPLSSAESNFGAARRRLFSKLLIPRGNLRPVRPGRGAARAYGRELLKETGGSGRLDLIFLGLGKDGHTASIFPGSAALKEDKKLVCAVRAPRGITPQRRVTLSLKAINKASAVVLMASGPDKKTIFNRARLLDKKIPAGLLHPRGELYFLFSEKA